MGKPYFGPISKLRAAIFATLQSPAAAAEVVVRFCRRRIDRTLKRINLSGPKSVGELIAEYSAQTASLDVAGLAAGATQKIQDALACGVLRSLLTIYDNKGLLALAAQHLKQARLLEAWLTRILRDEARAPELAAALKAVLPAVQATNDR